MNTTEVYEKLTSVNIMQQQRIWDERGKGYFGEYLLFRELYPNIKGQCKILMNLQIPTENGKKTEIDLLLIHESGLYVFEAKHYKGTIYGRFEDEIWTQYFRTQKNNHFNNPIKQNEYHIQALKDLFPNIPIYSFIVFTNSDVDIKVVNENRNFTVLCKLSELSLYINWINTLNQFYLSTDKINDIFNSLLNYSPINNDEVNHDGTTIPFTDFINQFKDDYSQNILSVKKQEKKRFARKTAIIIVVAVLISFIIFIIALSMIFSATAKVSEYQKEKLKAEQELESFSKKFKSVEPMNNGNVKFKDGFFEVTELSIVPSQDLKDTFIFSCEIQINGNEYGIRIDKNTSIIVQLKDGSVREYNLGKVSGLITTHIVGPFNGYYNTFKLPNIPIYTAAIEDITYIKLTNANVCSYSKMSSSLLPGIEFELYSAIK